MASAAEPLATTSPPSSTSTTLSICKPTSTPRTRDTSLLRSRRASRRVLGRDLGNGDRAVALLLQVHSVLPVRHRELFLRRQHQFVAASDREVGDSDQEVDQRSDHTWAVVLVEEERDERNECYSTRDPGAPDPYRAAVRPFD